MSLLCYIYIIYKAYPPKPAITKKRGNHQWWPIRQSTSTSSSLTVIRPLVYLSRNEIILTSGFGISLAAHECRFWQALWEVFPHTHQLIFSLPEQASAFVSGFQRQTLRRELTRLIYELDAVCSYLYGNNKNRTEVTQLCH